MKALLEKIDKTTVNLYPKAIYDGPLELIDTEETYERAIKELNQQTLLGIDSETKPSFKKGHINQVCLLQIASADKAYLFRLNKIGFPDSLIDLLSNKEITKVGLSLHDDFLMFRRKQENSNQDIKPKGVVELQHMVPKYGIGEKGLQKIYAILFKQKLSKSQRLTNWEAEELTPAQQRYAAFDAVACLQIYNELLLNYTKGKYKVIPYDDNQEEQIALDLLKQGIISEKDVEQTRVLRLERNAKKAKKKAEHEAYLAKQAAKKSIETKQASTI